jgi:glutamate dehydrogenase
VAAAVPELLVGRDAEVHARRREELDALGVGPELAGSLATLPFLQGVLSVVQTAEQAGRDPLAVARVHFRLADQLGLDRLQRRVAALPRTERWDAMARNALRDELATVHSQLTSEVLTRSGAGERLGGDGDDALETWWAATPAVEGTVVSLEEICDAEPTLARMSVGLRLVRSLLTGTA